MNRIQARKIITSKNPTILELQDARRVLRPSCFQTDENLVDLATARINGAAWEVETSINKTRRLCLIGVAAVLLALAALPSFAWADEPGPLSDRVTVYHDARPSDAWYARLVVENRHGVFNETRTYSTTHGDVSVQYTTTIPSAVNDPASADPVCVVSLPDGVLAVPMCMDVMEQETATIFLMLYIGG